MKIDTLEKLEILIFGLNAGRDLDLFLECGTGDGLHFGDFSANGFHIDNNGNLEHGAYDTGAHDTGAFYMFMGCLQHSKEEAAQWFSHISKKGGAEDASDS